METPVEPVWSIGKVSGDKGPRPSRGGKGGLFVWVKLGKEMKGSMRGRKWPPVRTHLRRRNLYKSFWVRLCVSSWALHSLLNDPEHAELFRCWWDTMRVKSLLFKCRLLVFLPIFDVLLIHLETLTQHWTTVLIWSFMSVCTYEYMRTTVYICFYNYTS